VAVSEVVVLVAMVVLVAQVEGQVAQNLLPTLEVQVELAQAVVPRVLGSKMQVAMGQTTAELFMQVRLVAEAVLVVLVVMEVAQPLLEGLMVQEEQVEPMLLMAHQELIVKVEIEMLQVVSVLTRVEGLMVQELCHQLQVHRA
jgi:hypothetical protein